MLLPWPWYEIHFSMTLIWYEIGHSCSYRPEDRCVSRNVFRIFLKKLQSSVWQKLNVKLSCVWHDADLSVSWNWHEYGHSEYYTSTDMCDWINIFRMTLKIQIPLSGKPIDAYWRDLYMKLTSQWPQTGMSMITEFLTDLQKYAIEKCVSNLLHKFKSLHMGNGQSDIVLNLI